MCYINDLPFEKIKIEISISWCVEKYNLHTNHAPQTENQGHFNWQRNFHHHWYLMNLPKLCCVCVFTQGRLCGRPGGVVWTSPRDKSSCDAIQMTGEETAGRQQAASISAKSNQHLRSKSGLTWPSIQHEKVICGDGSLQVWKSCSLYFLVAIIASKLQKTIYYESRQIQTSHWTPILSVKSL